MKQKTVHEKKEEKATKKNINKKNVAKKQDLKKSTQNKKTDKIVIEEEKINNSKKHTSKKKEKFSFKKLTIILAILVLVLSFIFLLILFLKDETQQSNIEENLIDENSTQIQLGEVLAIVDGEEIVSAQVEFAIQMAQQQGQELTQAQALEQVIIEIALIQEATKGNFIPNHQEVEESISEQLSMQGITLEEYKTQMSSMGVNYDEEIIIYAQQLGIQEYLESEIKSFNTEVSKEEIEEVYQEYSLNSQEDVLPLEELELEIKEFLVLEKKRALVDEIIFKLLEEKNIEFN